MSLFGGVPPALVNLLPESSTRQQVVRAAYLVNLLPGMCCLPLPIQRIGARHQDTGCVAGFISLETTRQHVRPIGG